MKEVSHLETQLKEIFQRLIENNVISLFLLNEQGEIQNYNANASLQLGFDINEFKDEPFYQLFHDQYKEVVKQQFTNFLNGKFTKEIVTIVSPDNKQLTFQLSFSIAEFNGKSYGIYGLLSQADQQEMPTYNHIVKDVIDQLDVSIWAADYRTKKYLHVSHGSEKVYGYTSEQFYNDPLLWAKVIYPEDLPRVEEGQLKLRDGQAIDSEYRIYHANGELRWISDQVIPKLDDQGKIIQYMGIIKDITDKKMAEHLLAESEQKFKSLYDYNPFAVYTLNTTGEFTDGNTTSERLIGYSKQDLIGRSFLPIIAESSQQKAMGYFQEVLKGEAVNYNIEAVQRNGSLINLNITNIPVIVNGKVVGVHGIAKDLSTLQESEEKYRNLVEQSLVGVYIIQDGKFVYTNKTLLSMFGYKDPIVGKQSIEVIHPDDRPFIEKNMEKRIAGEEVPTSEAKAIKADGSVFHIELLGTKTTYQGKDAVTGMVLDITQRKVMEGTVTAREQQLIAKEERFKSLIQYSADIVKVLDEKGKITYIGPTVENLTEKPVAEYLGRDDFDFVHPEDRKIAKEKFKEIIKTENTPLKYELRVELTTNRYYHCEVTAVNRLNDPSVEGIVFNYKDITEQKHAQQKIHHLAYHDDLTGLPNRRYLLERLSNMVSEAKKNKEQFSLFFFDLDGFKFVNDSLGHFAGDELLKQVAERLLELSPQGFVARNGGDEFTVVIKNISDKQTEKFAEQLLDIFKKPFKLNNYDFYVTISIGVTSYPEAGDSVQPLLKNADIAMYQAKESGKNNYKIYTASMAQKAIKTFTLRNDLRKALDNNEFLIHYQPRIDVSSNDIIGAEALLRWKHPEFGYVSPVEFIPLAEETGLIIPISNWVLETVCSHHKQWVNRGLNPIKVSVNFSALQFLQKDLLETLISIFKETDMDPNFLEIEITESVVMEHKDPVLATIEKMKAMGIHIAIDDFGTGYSSISYLKKFKIDTLKIDRSFIKAIPNDLDSVELTNATIHLAQSLGLGIVAEGVETTAQLNTLRKSGCYEVQGFLFSKPIPENDFQTLLNEKICHPKR